jgi:anti-anti-sigma factor
MPDDTVAIQVINERGYVIIRIGQNLDRGINLTPLRECIQQTLDAGNTRIALSLSQGSFLYSEILAHIVTYYKMIAARGGSLWLVQSNEKVLFILETLGLTDMIRIVAKESDLK